MITAYYGPRSSPAENKAVGDFISTIVWGEPARLGEYCTMGVFDKGELVAGTAYNNWEPDSGVIELVSGSTTARWLTRPVVRAMFYLPFVLLGSRLVALRVSEHNETMRAIAMRFGFEETIIPRIRADNEAECVYTLTADDWSKHRMNR